MRICNSPAPLQLNALGYAGTSCCSFIHALLSDAVSAPPELRAHYSEALLLLPPSHHVLPHKAIYGDTQNTPPYTREALGLPRQQTHGVKAVQVAVEEDVATVSVYVYTYVRNLRTYYIHAYTHTHTLTHIH